MIPSCYTHKFSLVNLILYTELNGPFNETFTSQNGIGSVVNCSSIHFCSVLFTAVRWIAWNTKPDSHLNKFTWELNIENWKNRIWVNLNLHINLFDGEGEWDEVQVKRSIRKKRENRTSILLTEQYIALQWVSFYVNITTKYYSYRNCNDNTTGWVKA